MNKEQWAALPSEEKEEIRARNRASRARRKIYEEEKLERSREQGRRDERARHMKPGDWLRYPEGRGGIVCLIGKIVRFKDWNDDGHNHKRAPRNKKITVEIEPHLYDEPEVLGIAKLGSFYPVSEMKVIAEAARG